MPEPERVSGSEQKMITVGPDMMHLISYIVSRMPHKGMIADPDRVKFEVSNEQIDNFINLPKKELALLKYERDLIFPQKKIVKPPRLQYELFRMRFGRTCVIKRLVEEGDNPQEERQHLVSKPLSLLGKRLRSELDTEEAEAFDIEDPTATITKEEETTTRDWFRKRIREKKSEYSFSRVDRTRIAY